MKPSAFEERLIALAGADTLAAAKQLLKQKLLLGAWRDRRGRLAGRFHGTEGNTDTSVTTGEVPCCACSCHSDSTCCAHALALMMYAGRFKTFPAPPEMPPNYYGGLRKDNLEKLSLRGHVQPAAKLFLHVVSEAPHVPSKWENLVLAVRMRTAEREYIGNQSNLRQLYFDKSLSVVLKLDCFSLHEQQIIRFLAINGEPENSNVRLNSELTAELFHALAGFPRFLQNGRQLTVRPERAEAVLIRDRSRYTPGILVNGAVLPLGGAKVIAGRTGCWIGRDGEYFFVGANCEVGFLRSFFRCPAHTEAVITPDFPLPVLQGRAAEPELRRAGVMLDGTFDAGGFELRFEYLYRVNGRNLLFAPRTGTLNIDRGTFWKRDRDFERSFESSLELFGFTITEENCARLTSADAAGLFLDRALPELLLQANGVALSGPLAAWLRGEAGVPELEFRCRLAETKTESYLLRFSLSSGSITADWDSALGNARENRDFLVLPGHGLAKIPAPLGRFLRAAPHLFRTMDPAGCTLELPFYNGAYYCELAREVPGALIPEIAAGPTALPAPPAEFHFKGELRNYQREGVAFLQYLTDRNFNGLLADEMGLGKTVQLLALLASRLPKRGGLPALIICPASLTANWEREAQRFVPEFKVAAPHGHERKQVLSRAEEYHLIVLSYAAAKLGKDELRKLKFSYLVLDEAQHIKNPGSGNARSCKELRADHRIVLSGTPLENTPEDLWSIMDFLQPGMLGTLPAFRREYAGLADRPEAKEDLARRAAPFIKRRTKSEVAQELPSRTEHTLYCTFSPAQRKLYESTLTEGRNRIEEAYRSGECGRGTAVLSTLLRLRQVCCHPELLPRETGNGIPSAKTELLLELLDETLDSGHKVLVFSQFTSLLQLLIPELHKRRIPFEYLDGATLNRQQHVDHFNNSPEIPLFLLSLKAGGTGLNLTGADTVIIYDPWWNPAAEQQAADRTHRIGQTRAVNILRLVVKDSVEEKILALQGKKRELFNAVIADPAAGGGMSLDELRALLA